jgi:AcrR family transcriptional regulator
MARSARARHAVAGGYPCGEETRTRIIAVAIRLFGDRGFEGASTRDIATSAGVTAPALQYYFDNKEGLYLACADYIATRIWDHLAEVVGRAEQILADNGDETALIEAFCAIQAQAADWMFTSRDTHDWRLFMARQQAGLGPPAGFEIINQRVNRRVQIASVAIVDRLLGRAKTDEESLIRTLALGGQLVIFQVLRGNVLSALNWDAIDAGRSEFLTRIVSEQTAVLLRYFSAMRDAAGDPAGSSSDAISASSTAVRSMR